MKSTILHFYTLLFSIAVLTSLNVNAQIYTAIKEGFDSIPATWTIKNNSSPLGANSWFQGVVNPGSSITFIAYDGDSTAYIAANYSAVNTRGTISDWLITPKLVIQNGATFSFWTRTVLNSKYADRIEVRLNKIDTTTNVGNSATSVGSFTDSLLSVNPTLVVGGYPDTGWTQYKVTLSGITSVDTGRIAIRYFVTDGGLTGTASNYIGIDDVLYSAGTLPVTFISFNGVLENNIAVLNWSTANEINNMGYDVERSTNGQTFASIGFVQGRGNTNAITDYSFSDPKLVSGDNYYRLKQIDLNGNYKYSSVIHLAFSKFAWNILGNGSSNSWLQLQLDKPHNVALQILSMNGNAIQTINKGNLSEGTYSIPLNTAQVASGMYIVKLIIDSKVYSKNIIK